MKDPWTTFPSFIEQLSMIRDAKVTEHILPFHRTAEWLITRLIEKAKVDYETTSESAIRSLVTLAFQIIEFVNNIPEPKLENVKALAQQSLVWPMIVSVSDPFFKNIKSLTDLLTLGVAHTFPFEPTKLFKGKLGKSRPLVLCLLSILEAANHVEAGFTHGSHADTKNISKSTTPFQCSEL